MQWKQTNCGWGAEPHEITAQQCPSGSLQLHCFVEQEYCYVQLRSGTAERWRAGGGGASNTFSMYFFQALYLLMGCVASDSASNVNEKYDFKLHEVTALS